MSTLVNNSQLASYSNSIPSMFNALLGLSYDLRSFGITQYNLFNGKLRSYNGRLYLLTVNELTNHLALGFSTNKADSLKSLNLVIGDIAKMKTDLKVLEHEAEIKKKSSDYWKEHQELIIKVHGAILLIRTKLNEMIKILLQCYTTLVDSYFGGDDKKKAYGFMMLNGMFSNL